MSKSEKEIYELSELKQTLELKAKSANNEKTIRRHERTKKMVELTNEYVDLSPEGATLDGYFCAEHLRIIAHEIDQLKAMERKEEVKGTL